MTKTEQIVNNLPPALAKYLDTLEGRPQPSPEPQPAYLFANILNPGPNKSIRTPRFTSLWTSLGIALSINAALAFFVFLSWKLAKFLGPLMAIDIGFLFIALTVVLILTRRER